MQVMSSASSLLSVALHKMALSILLTKRESGPGTREEVAPGPKARERGGSLSLALFIGTLLLIINYFFDSAVRQFRLSRCKITKLNDCPIDRGVQPPIISSGNSNSQPPQHSFNHRKLALTS